MIRLCTTQFWDKNITSSPYPYLTECFRNTVLQWMPIGIFWLITPLSLYILLKRQIQLQPLPISTLFIIKMILAILCLLVQIMRIIHYVMLPTTKQYHVLWLTPVLYMITMIFILWLMNYDRRKGTFSSGLLFIFWLLVCLAIVPDVIDCFAQFQQQNKSIALWMGCVCTWLHLFVALGSFVANCFAEKYVSSELELDPRPIVPEQYASFLSQIFYSWATPLILQGYKKSLTEDDCWQLPISERTVSMVRRVRTFLPESNNRTTTIVDKSNTSCNDDEVTNRNHSEDESRDLLNNMPLVVVNKTPIRSHKKIVFWHALFHAFKDKLIAGGLMRLIYDILQLIIPMIIKLFLNFFTDPKNPTWLGIFYAILLSTIVFCQILFLRAYFHCQRLLGFRFRAAITGLVYRKSLKLSNSSKQATTTGEIINLMTIDASRFNDIGSEIHHIWSSPVMIILSIYLLYRQMQLAIIPGVTLLLLMISINLFLQKIQKKFTVQQMILKDQRIQMTNEILNGIKVLKLYAWETTFIRSVTHIREKELRYIRYKSILSAISNVLSTFTPILVCIVTFATYVLSSNTNVLTAEKAFVSLALFNLLQTPLAKFPTTINSIVEASVSDKRIQKFLNYEEIDVDAVNKLSSGPDTSKFSDGNSVKIEDGSFHWSNHIDDQLVLKNINLKIRHGSLVALVGKVSSGKSSILAALLGEMTKVNGRVTISENLAYVPQTAWIMNTTLKKNILFGRDFDQKRYDRIIEACSLKQDLDILPARDETEIGEKGINLSGGQRQRVSLARSLYTDADIFLLDDPLSAVDAHVGAHIFEHVIGPQGLLSDKTRIFVTHTLSHLHKCDDIVVISHGEIVDHGSYNELMQKSKILKELVHSIVTSEKEQYQQQASKVEMRKRAPATPIELIQNPCHKIEDDIPNDQSQSTTIEIIPSDIEEVRKQLIQKEVLQTGSVKLNIYAMYIKACKFSMVALITLFFCLTVSAALGTNIWLSKWTDNSKVEAVKNVTSSSSNDQIYRLHVYSALGIAQGFLGFFMQLTLKLAAYGAARKLHWMLLIGVLHAPMSFFDTTPIGRIINRFAKDVDSIDSVLPNSFSFSLKTLVPVVVTLAILIYGSWLVIIALLPLAILFAFIQRVFVSTSRQLRRLDSTTRSLIYANFGETIQGVSSIRAYNVQQRFIDISDHFIDINQSCAFANSVANTWLAVRLEMISNLLTLLTAVSVVLLRHRLTAGTVGLMITYSIQITQSLQMLVREVSEIETNIVGVERINEYATLTPEAPWEIHENKPSPHWPTKGEIRIKELSARYRDNSELVLNNLTIHIQPGEKIGIIGRTGSGKSSLCMTLFRIIESINGQIIIDDVDIRHIGLHDLRSKITIIPQDAVIFAGTVRFNVDPFGSYSDTEIWNVLTSVHMKECVGIMENGLSHLLTEEGGNLSAGERQLLCLARALLRKSKIIVLDEATATIDMETDRLIQLTIRSVFKDATVLTVAHRLHTILDSTKILVLSDGCLLEYDEPARLAANPNSIFTKLLCDANIHPSDIKKITSSSKSFIS